jgi:hypothetical protein
MEGKEPHSAALRRGVLSALEDWRPLLGLRCEEREEEEALLESPRRSLSDLF